ncbi:hypothetical protein ACFVRR_23035 [Gottfriedia sp. NPDC057948]|uniref:hypothetical protein n=1 Tax=Gottfriedia sp. NPDC057948 TaxID=3346287 RepID=UPI0036DB3A28
MDDLPKDKIMEPVKSVSAHFDSVISNISLNWKCPKELIPSTFFEVSYSVNGGKVRTQKIQGTSTRISGIIPGNVIKINIIATS